MVDLGAWLDAEYSIRAEPEDDDQPNEATL